MGGITIFKEKIIQLCQQREIDNIDFIRMTYLFPEGTPNEIDEYLNALVQSAFSIYQTVTKAQVEFKDLKILKNEKASLLLGVIGKDCFINLSVATYYGTQNHNLHIEISSNQGLIEFDPENDKAFTGPNELFDYFEGTKTNKLCMHDFIKAVRE
ncbi:hypothetical protein LB941_00300 [Ligilactobacillus sp. WILCCON 0076]|uniref:Uncharacterized protein n=1 Tax=Ligilactobacillus ubinensis TaxID=2876789 RepID=A0A9X2FIX1_9LACO|nr:hypothetical protein [Ligilactobacillus ubinensis]MCP0885771.1 hypothetical protein [Ligilactobacillus ubinensis]